MFGIVKQLSGPGGVAWVYRDARVLIQLGPAMSYYGYRWGGEYFYQPVNSIPCKRILSLLAAGKCFVSNSNNAYCSYKIAEGGGGGSSF